MFAANVTGCSLLLTPAQIPLDMAAAYSSLAYPIYRGLEHLCTCKSIGGAAVIRCLSKIGGYCLIGLSGWGPTNGTGCESESCCVLFDALRLRLAIIYLPPVVFEFCFMDIIDEWLLHPFALASSVQLSVVGRGYWRQETVKPLWRNGTSFSGELL